MASAMPVIPVSHEQDDKMQSLLTVSDWKCSSRCHKIVPPAVLRYPSDHSDFYLRCQLTRHLINVSYTGKDGEIYMT